MEKLTQSARELVENCPHLINRFAARLEAMIDNFPAREESDAEEDGDLPTIVHAGYTAAECGREK